MNALKISELIPNRPPYLWVDHVVEVKNESIHTRKFISPDLPVFQGHYPGNPVFPAALQCECAFQASAILIASLGVSTAGKIPVVARANDLKFRKVVRPGVWLDVHVDLQNTFKDVFYLKARILREDECVSSLTFVTTAADLPDDEVSK